MKVWKFDRILLTVISNQNSQFQGSNKTIFLLLPLQHYKNEEAVCSLRLNEDKNHAV